MALHEVTAQPIGQPDRPFQVDRVAGPQRAEVGAAERLVDDVRGPRCRVDVDDGEAAAVDRDRVADLAVLDDDARAEREPVAVAADDLAELLDDPGEHCLFPGRGPNPALLPEMGPLPHPVPYVEPQVVS